jgi:hypothetical protein
MALPVLLAPATLPCWLAGKEPSTHATVLPITLSPQIAQGPSRRLSLIESSMSAPSRNGRLRTQLPNVTESVGLGSNFRQNP